MAADNLTNVMDSALVRQLDWKSRYVILSDLHMGDGSKNDDFALNGPMVLEALEKFYFPKGYTLVLNGDIEELLRSRREDILKTWPDMYRVFHAFRAQGRLIWLQGNHEIIPQQKKDPSLTAHYDGQALRLDWEGRSFLVFHGHQAGAANSGKYNRLIGWSLRLFANTLGIGNRSVAHDSDKKFKIEKQVYEFSRSSGIASIIGHTHRPLFESLSKYESLGYQIENKCREYAEADPVEKTYIKASIQKLKAEYLAKPDPRSHRLADTVYGSILTPCLFNAGCGIGKRGVTALEIKNGRLQLVFWSSPRRTRKFAEYNAYKPPVMIGEDAWRIILRRESLDYIFARIELLG